MIVPGETELTAPYWEGARKGELRLQWCLEEELFSHYDEHRAAIESSINKARGLDLSAILTPAEEPDEFLGSYAVHDQDHELEDALDNELMQLAQPAIDGKGPVRKTLNIVNTNQLLKSVLKAVTLNGMY